MCYSVMGVRAAYAYGALTVEVRRRTLTTLPTPEALYAPHAPLRDCRRYGCFHLAGTKGRAAHADTRPRRGGEQLQRHRPILPGGKACSAIYATWLLSDPRSRRLGRSSCR